MGIKKIQISLNYEASTEFKIFILEIPLISPETNINEYVKTNFHLYESTFLEDEFRHLVQTHQQNIVNDYILQEILENPDVLEDIEVKCSVTISQNFQPRESGVTELNKFKWLMFLEGCLGIDAKILKKSRMCLIWHIFDKIKDKKITRKESFPYKFTTVRLSQSYYIKKACINSMKGKEWPLFGTHIPLCFQNLDYLNIICSDMFLEDLHLLLSSPNLRFLNIDNGDYADINEKPYSVFIEDGDFEKLNTNSPLLKIPVEVMKKLEFFSVLTNNVDKECFEHCENIIELKLDHFQDTYKIFDGKNSFPCLKKLTVKNFQDAFDCSIVHYFQNLEELTFKEYDQSSSDSTFLLIHAPKLQSFNYVNSNVKQKIKINRKPLFVHMSNEFILSIH